MEASEILENSITDEEKVNSALFDCLYPSYRNPKKVMTIENALAKYYDEYFSLPLPADVIRRKVKKRTKVLLDMVKGFIPRDLSDRCTFDDWKVFYQLEKARNIMESRRLYNALDQRIDFESYRKTKSVSMPSEMADVKDLKTKQILLRYKILSHIEFILNEMLKRLDYVDAIVEFQPVVLRPDNGQEVLTKIESYCANNFIPEYSTSIDRVEILDRISRARDKNKVKKVLDTIYEYMAFPRLKKRDACAIVYILFDRRKDIGFVSTIENFTQFKEEIYSYYRLKAPTYKFCKLESTIDDYRIRVENIIKNIK